MTFCCDQFGTLGKSLKGGCGFFVLEDLCFNPRTDLDFLIPISNVNLKQTG